MRNCQKPCEYQRLFKGRVDTHGARESEHRAYNQVNLSSEELMLLDWSVEKTLESPLDCKI